MWLGIQVEISSQDLQRHRRSAVSVELRCGDTAWLHTARCLKVVPMAVCMNLKGFKGPVCEMFIEARLTATLIAPCIESSQQSINDSKVFV